MNLDSLNLPNDAYPFTPLPWVIHDHWIRSADGVVIAKAPAAGTPSYQFWAINKKLIAAAPDLLEASQLALDALSIAGQSPVEALIALQKAIKKAYGK